MPSNSVSAVSGFAPDDIFGNRNGLTRLDTEGMRDWQKVVDMYDAANAFIYFDPPYCTGDAGTYDAFAPEDMQILRNRLYTLKGKWILSCDGSDICREIFADFTKVEVPYHYSSGTQYVGRPLKSEMLVACDALAEALQDNFKRLSKAVKTGIDVTPLPEENASYRACARRRTA